MDSITQVIRGPRPSGCAAFEHRRVRPATGGPATRHLLSALSAAGFWELLSASLAIAVGVGHGQLKGRDAEGIGNVLLESVVPLGAELVVEDKASVQVALDVVERWTAEVGEMVAFPGFTNVSVTVRVAAARWQRPVTTDGAR